MGPKDSQSLTLCLNSTKIVETLDDVMVKARAMYDAGAYLHWFWKHGCSKVTAIAHLWFKCYFKKILVKDILILIGKKKNLA